MALGQSPIPAGVFKPPAPATVPVNVPTQEPKPKVIYRPDPDTEEKLTAAEAENRRLRSQLAQQRAQTVAEKTRADKATEDADTAKAALAKATAPKPALTPTPTPAPAPAPAPAAVAAAPIAPTPAPAAAANTRPAGAIGRYDARPDSWAKVNDSYELALKVVNGKTIWAPAMMPIPATGSNGFMMGSPTGETGQDSDEKQHKVVIDYPFSMGKTEVTFAQWADCVADGGCKANPNPHDNNYGGGTRLVISVSWNHAQEYVEWLNAKTGFVQIQKVGDKEKNVHPHRYRLPTEAEWEYAARAGNKGPFGFKNNANISPSLARYNWSVSHLNSQTRTWETSTVPVGSYEANAWGLHDMHGNVWEWVQDCYEPDYAKTQGFKDGSAHKADDPACPIRVLRGGSWSDNPLNLRSANRDWGTPSTPYYNVGFRLARMLAP